MKINHASVMGALLILAGCGSSAEVPPPPESVGLEAPSDTPSRNARIAGRWLSTAASMPAGAIRLEISRDGTYRMKMLEARSALVEAIVSASAGDLTWNKAGFLHGRDEHPAPEMKRFGRWTAGFEEDGARIVVAPDGGRPVAFEREAES